MERRKIIKDLEKILGKEKVYHDKSTIKMYSMDAVYLEGDAIAVIFPENSQEVSEIVKYAYQKDLKLYPQGSASEIVGSTTPRNDGIIINFSRMDKIEEINYIDSYVVIQPGVRLIELNNILNEKGYMFPVDPASIKSATIGGAINSGSGGMMGAKYGTMKDWVLGLEVVLPDEDGTIINLGGKTTKNREGYDLIRLIIGSEGTLALVTKAILRITLAPENVVTIAGFFENLSDLMKTVVEIKRRKLDILIMEFVDDITSKTTIKMIGSRIYGEGSLLITSIATTMESGERVLKSLEEAYKVSGANKIYKALNLREAEDMGLYDIRRNYYPAAIKEAAGERLDEESKPLVYVEDVSVPPTKLVEAVKEIRGLAREYNIPLALGGHLSDGNIHPVIWINEKDIERREIFNNFIHDIMKLAIKFEGVVSSEHGIGTMKKNGIIMAYESKKSLKAIDIMKKIKKIFDPKNLLNPDKIFL